MCEQVKKLCRAASPRNPVRRLQSPSCRDHIDGRRKGRKGPFPEHKTKSIRLPCDVLVSITLLGSVGHVASRYTSHYNTSSGRRCIGCQNKHPPPNPPPKPFQMGTPPRRAGSASGCFARTRGSCSPSQQGPPCPPRRTPPPPFPPPFLPPAAHAQIQRRTWVSGFSRLNWCEHGRGCITRAEPETLSPTINPSRTVS